MLGKVKLYLLNMQVATTAQLVRWFSFYVCQCCHCEPSICLVSAPTSVYIISLRHCTLHINVAEDKGQALRLSLALVRVVDDAPIRVLARLVHARASVLLHMHFPLVLHQMGCP